MAAPMFSLMPPPQKIINKRSAAVEGNWRFSEERWQTLHGLGRNLFARGEESAPWTLGRRSLAGSDVNNWPHKYSPREKKVLQSAVRARGGGSCARLSGCLSFCVSCTAVGAAATAKKKPMTTLREKLRVDVHLPPPLSLRACFGVSQQRLQEKETTCCLSKNVSDVETVWKIDLNCIHIWQRMEMFSPTFFWSALSI